MSCAGRPNFCAELHQFGLRQWRVNVVADVDARQCVCAIYALGIFDIHREAFAPLLGIRELQVAPRFDVLGDVLGVVVVREILVGALVHQAQLAVVEVERAVRL